MGKNTKPEKSSSKTSKAKFKYYLFSVLILLLSLGLGQVFAGASSLDDRLENLKTDIANVQTEYEGNKNYQNSLAEEIKQNQLQNKNIKNIIDQNTTLSQSLSEKISQSEIDLQVKNLQLKSLIREVQKKTKDSPIKTILSGQSLGNAMSQAYNLSTIEQEVSSKISSIENERLTLEKNKTDLEKANKDLSNMQTLLASRESYLTSLLEETKGKEELYQQKLNSLSSERDLLKGVATSKPYYPLGGNGGGPECAGKINLESKKLDLKGVLLVVPTYGYVSQTIHCDGDGHDAIDIANAIGTPIFSIYDGTIMAKGYEGSGYGNYLLIKHTIDNQNFYSVYGHMVKPSDLSTGQTVTRGQQIGSMGSTGFSTGSHLHFALLSDSYEYTKSMGCNRKYGSTGFCYNPLDYVRL